MSAQGEGCSGGCQCGAVRYRFLTRPRAPLVCHCRMCQKAFGSPFAALVGAPREAFELTRGTIATFMSSDRAERGFCRDCGTPLTYALVSGNWLCVSICSLDEPEAFPPREQHGVEARLGWLAHLAEIPERRPTADENPASAAIVVASNRQHPDHDTDVWPPAIWEGNR